MKRVKDNLCGECGYDKREIGLCSACMTRSHRRLRYEREEDIEYYRHQSYMSQSVDYVFTSKVLPYTKPTF